MNTLNTALQNPTSGAIMGMLFVVLVLALTHFVSLRVSGSVG
jgi:hypothetical protein